MKSQSELHLMSLLFALEPMNQTPEMPRCFLNSSKRTTFIVLSLTISHNAADQQRDRRQACLPAGLAAAFAGCEARSAEQPADDHPLLFAD